MVGHEVLEPYAVALRDAAMQQVQDERGVRVEDYLAVLAAATGEAAIVASGAFDIERNDLTPGAAVFGDAINTVLTGDSLDVATVPAESVIGVLRDRLVPTGVVDLAAFGSLEQHYRHVAETVGDAAWGDVVVTVPPDNEHGVLPLRAAFELRPAVQAVGAALDLAIDAGSVTLVRAWAPHQLCALALASAIEQTRGAIDVHVGLTLALEVVFAMAKMVPMSSAAFHQAAEEET